MTHLLLHPTCQPRDGEPAARGVPIDDFIGAAKANAHVALVA